MAEADNLPTERKQLRDDSDLMGCHPSRSNDLSVHARIDSTGCVPLLWESNEEDDEDGHAAIFEVTYGRKGTCRTSAVLVDGGSSECGLLFEHPSKLIGELGGD